MPYFLKKGRKNGRTLWLIIRKHDRKVVGSSSSQRKARISIWHRLKGE